MKKVKLLFVLFFVCLGVIFLQNNVYASLQNQTDLIRIKSSTIDFTITNTTTISQIIEVFGEPKIVTDSAFGGHAYTFYTDDNYSNYLYIETLKEDKGIIGFASICPGYEVYKDYQGYDDQVSVTQNTPLSGYYINGGYNDQTGNYEVKGGMYYNWNKWVNRNSSDTINLFKNTYRSNPQHYLKGLSEHAAAMYNAICVINGYSSTMEFNEEMFYINEQMKQNGSSLRSYAINMNKKQYVDFIGTRFNFDLAHTNGYYILNPVMYAEMFYEYGTNRHDYTVDYAIMDYDIDNQLITAIGIDKDLLTYYEKVPLTADETSKLERARSLYETAMQTLGDEEANIFATQPISNVASQLKAGELKSNYKSAIITYYNAIRAGQGLSEVTQNADAFNRAQHMAVLNSYIVNEEGGQISHSPAKPAGVSTEFYNTARGWGQVSYAENIAWSNGQEANAYAMRKYIHQFLDDSTETGLTYSHRISLLHPTNSEAGYGIAYTVGALEFAHDEDLSTGNEVVTWPSTGVTFLETLDSYKFNWSAQFYNGYQVKETTTVNVECLTDGKTWTFDTLSSSYTHYYTRYYQTGAEEMKNRVIFGDSTMVPQPGFVYEITVNGLKDENGNTVSYTYRSAFDYADESKYGSPLSNIDITIPENICADPNQSGKYYVPVGEEVDFGAQIDDKVKDIKVTWSTTDQDITLTQSGTVLIPQDYTLGQEIPITVTSDSSEASDTIIIIPYKKKNQITFNPEALEIDLDKTASHKVEITNVNAPATPSEIKWEIASETSPDTFYELDDETISKYIEVNVDSSNNAYVTAKELPYGNNKFRLRATAKTAYGEYQGEILITVNNPVTHVKVFYNYTSNEVYSVTDLGLSVTYSYDEDGIYYGVTSLSYNTILDKTKSNDLFLKTELEPKNTTVSLDTEWEVISGEDVISKKDENGTFSINKYGRAVITARNIESGVIGKIIINVEEPIQNISITGRSETIYYRENSNTDQIEVTRTPVENFSDISYKSSNTLIAKVDKNGLVTFLGSTGQVTITGTHSMDSSVKDTFTYLVKIPVDKLSFGNYYTILRENQTYQNTARPTPTISGASQAITYSSSDPTVASVESTTGKVTAKKVGSATITATLGEGFSDKDNITANYNVHVVRNITSLTVDAPATIDLTEGSKPLTINVVPQNHTDELVSTFVSSNESIASVDENGVVTPHKAGSVVITCTFKSTYEIEGEEIVNVNKTVRKTIRVTSSRINLGSSTYTVNAGNTVNMNATTYPNNDSLNSNMMYKSEDESIVRVDEQGNLIPTGVGSTTVTAYINPDAIHGGTIEATATVYATNNVTSASLSVPEKLTTQDKPKTCSVLLTPANHSDDVKITWESSNPNVARIDSTTGVITPVSAGNTLIRATVIATYTTDRKRTSLSTVLSQSVTVEYVEEPDYLLGDINEDGKINADDAANAIEIFKTNNQTPVNIKKGDMDGNGTVNAEDAALIIEYFKTHH